MNEAFGRIFVEVILPMSMVAVALWVALVASLWIFATTESDYFFAAAASMPASVGAYELIKYCVGQFRQRKSGPGPTLPRRDQGLTET